MLGNLLEGSKVAEFLVNHYYISVIIILAFLVILELAIEGYYQWTEKREQHKKHPELKDRDDEW